MKDIHSEIVDTPFGEAEIVRQDQSTCFDIDMTSPAGYWIWDDNEWIWVVDGCPLHPLHPDEANECIQTRLVATT